MSTTRDYLVQVELDSRDLTPEDVDAIHESLGEWKVSAAENLAGYVELTLTVPAERLRQATDTALLAAVEFGTPTAVYAITDELQQQREGMYPLPELVSVPEAAEILKVSRQYVLKLITDGKLPATQVARDYVIVKAALGQHMPADS